MGRIKKSAISLFLGTVTWLLAGQSAFAQLIDDITIVPTDGVAEIRIKTTAPVRYLRHFPPGKGEQVNVYFQVTSVDARDEPWREEHRKSPPSRLVPSFTVTLTALGATDVVRDPLYLAIQFSKPVSFKVRQGRDARSLILAIPLPPVGDGTTQTGEPPKP